jgi:hypothetical protein
MISGGKIPTGYGNLYRPTVLGRTPARDARRAGGILWPRGHDFLLQDRRGGNPPRQWH